MSEGSGLELINIYENNIDAAARKIIDVLEDTSRRNVIYFNGWEGFGASAVLKLVAQRLKSSTRLSKFDKVVHVDCSVWKSKRAVQKVVVEVLELPQLVMDILDSCDKHDDFNGVDPGSRGVVAEVWDHIFRRLADTTFAVIFHNGSSSYVDLSEFGIPVYPHNLSNKVLWTFHGRSRSYFLAAATKEEGKGDYGITNEARQLLGSTSVALSSVFTMKPKEVGSTMWGIVLDEAKDVAEHIGMPVYHKIVEECFLYMRPLQDMKLIDWETHASNFWVCDGIIQEGDTSAWEIGDAIQSYIHLEWRQNFTSYAVPFSTTHPQRDMPVLRQLPVYCSSSKVTNVPPEATSFFVAATGEADTVLLASMFQHSGSSALRVLHLSFCTFSFASPPFLCCSNLRFLLLDHCKDKDDFTNVVHEEHVSHSQSESRRACFRRLWVLDLRYTHWYQLLSEEMISFMSDLRELNVEGVEQKGKNWSITNLCAYGTGLVKLRVIVDPIPTDDEDTSENSLKMAMPPSLESFSFINKATTAIKISSISFRGCSRLKSILLRGWLGSLEELDLSGTAVKTLNLTELEAPNLERLFLLGCEKLCAILWPPKNKRSHALKVVHINTTLSTSPSQHNWKESAKEASAATRSSFIHTVAMTQPAGTRQAASFHFNWYISVRDTRFLRSLVPLKEYLERQVFVHMEMDSPSASCTAVGGSEVAQEISSLHKPDRYLYARDAVFGGHLKAGAPNVGAISWMWDCPNSPSPGDEDWYVHIQDAEETKWGLLQEQGSSFQGTSTGAALPPSFICDGAWSLHVHDNSSLTCIPFPEDSDWKRLRFCQVKSCPKLRVIFASPREIGSKNIFWFLTTFWASQLSMVCYVWKWGATSQPGDRSFEDLVFLHLDYCPRLIHVLPFSEHMATLPSLKTLEIVCCGDLREVFPLDPKRQERQKIIEFPNLRRIHLYELPLLQHICGSKMSAPKLKTVKIRGCWSLRSLPAVNGNTTNRPKVDCEKDWWDNLEWDGLAANHHPSLYELTHSMYYKKAQLPRGPLLT